MSKAGEIAVSRSLLFSAVISRLIRRRLTCTAMKKYGSKPGQAVFMGYPHIRGTVVAAEWQPSFIHLWPGIGCPDFLRPFEDTPPPSAIVTLEYPYAHSGVAVGFFCALCATPLPRPATRF